MADKDYDPSDPWGFKKQYEAMKKHGMASGLVFDLSASGIHPVGKDGKVHKPKEHKTTKPTYSPPPVDHSKTVFQIPSANDIDWEAMDKKFGNMWSLPSMPTEIIPTRLTTNSKSSKVVNTKPNPKPARVVHQPTPQYSFDIPTMGDMSASSGAYMPTMGDLMAGASRIPQQKPQPSKPQAGKNNNTMMGGDMNIMDISSALNGINNTIKGVQNASHNVGQAYRNIKQMTVAKKYKKALGNPNEDELHPDNLQTFKVGYEDYVKHPVTGKAISMADYIKWHNQQYVAGNTPSAKHTIKGDIKGFINRKIAEDSVKKLQALGRDQQAYYANADNEPPPTVDHVVDDAPAVDLEAQQIAQQRLDEIEAMEQVPQANQVDFPIEGVTPEQPALPQAPALPERPQTAENPQSVWCMYITEATPTTKGTISGQAGSRMICVEGYDRATTVQQQYRSRGMTVSGLFEKTS